MARTDDGVIEQESLVRTVLQTLLSLVATLSGVAGKLLGVLATFLTVAEGRGKDLLDEAEDRGRKLLHEVPTPARVARRRRMRAAGWFSGGLATGAAIGWFAHGALHGEAEEPASLTPINRDREVG